MLAIITLLLVISFSILITRIASVALTHTGLSKEAARFQARSAFTGVGFTTSESEKLVNHPVRRRVLLLLMLLGNAGIVTAVSTLLLGFVNTQEAGSVTLKIILLLSGLVLLWSVASSHWVDRHLFNLISWALRRYTRLEVQDYASLLHLAGEYRVSEMEIEPEDWVAGRRLCDAELRDEGILVLGITRSDGTYLGAPEGETPLMTGDILILYGRAGALEQLDQRRKGRTGDREHARAVSEYEDVVREERGVDPAEEKD